MTNKSQQISGLVGRMRMRGILTIHVKDAKTGAIIRTIHKQNVITNKAGDRVRELIAQRATDNPPAYSSMGSIRFGTSNIAPDRDQTNLQSELTSVRKQLTDSDKTNGVSGEIEFKATLLSGDANGATLREVGLFTTGNSWSGDVSELNGIYLFARQIHAAVEKTSALILEYNWAIQFTV